MYIEKSLGIYPKKAIKTNNWFAKDTGFKINVQKSVPYSANKQLEIAFLKQFHL